MAACADPSPDGEMKDNWVNGLWRPVAGKHPGEQAKSYSSVDGRFPLKYTVTLTLD